MIRNAGAPASEALSKPASASFAREVLGPSAFELLGPYLEFTRATAGDLFQLASPRGGTPAALEALRLAEAMCGSEVLRTIVAELGWASLNLGLEVRRYSAVSVDRSMPFVLPSAEARLLETLAEGRRVGECWLAIAHGAPRGESLDGSSPLRDDLVGRFRDYNLAHAELLSRLLVPGPLRRERVLDILRRVDHLVGEFQALFGTGGGDLAVLADVHRELRAATLAELERTDAAEAAEVSPRLTRLVLAFEDPSSCGRAGSLHGLKRWLHQQGLRLGFKLMRGGRGTDRTVDLLLLSPAAPARVVRRIRYADFEPPDDEARALRVPPPVRLAVEAFARQLLYGQEKLPDVEIFCYGCEVHYFLSFWNHPALLRINDAVPLRGGMIDLEYYGVSNYDLDAHPSPELEALRETLRALDIDVTVDGAHVHARFDKERSLDPDQLRDRAEAVLCLAPYLMDLDWTVGSLALDRDARRAVAQAWAERFALWGVLPLADVLTQDHRGILVARESGPTGEREIAWSGQAPYRDRFGPPPEAGRLGRLFDEVERLGVEVRPLGEGEQQRPIGQLGLERRVLRPLRAAVERGAVVLDAEEPRAAPGTRYRAEHETERFAAVLAAGGPEFAAAAKLARLVPLLERSVRFVTTGTVHGHVVQRARLPLHGEEVGLFVLRGRRGIARLACFARDVTLWQRRGPGGEAWLSNVRGEAAELVGLLRRGEYLAPGDESILDAIDEDTEDLRRRLCSEPHPAPPPPLPGECTVRGVEAAPGRAVGPARLDARLRPPGDLDGSILVASSIGPEDSAHLWRCAGVVSTGGGALSHAGLIAMQFGKPALIVQGSWRRDPAGRPELTLTTSEYREEEREIAGFAVRMRRAVRQREHRVREGDLLVLDANAGTLQDLGQSPEVLALHAETRTLEDATARLASATDDGELLILRGRRLRAFRGILKLLGRASDPVLVRHAVHDILFGRTRAAGVTSEDENVELLAAALANDRAGPVAAAHLRWSIEALCRQRDGILARVARRVPRSHAPFEILWMQAQARDVRAALGGAARALRCSGLETPAVDRDSGTDVDRLARRRLHELRQALARELHDATRSPGDASVGHLFRRLRRVDALVRRPASEAPALIGLGERLRADAERRRHDWRERRILRSAEVDLDAAPLVGWKAANLGEVQRICGAALVPEWFALTDRAFREALECPIERIDLRVEAIPRAARTLGQVIDAVLAQDRRTDEEKSSLVAGLWEGLRLPAPLAEEIATGYRALSAAAAASAAEPGPPFVAVRSSGIEEDAEAAARAGDFDTFLFVRGEDELLAHVKRAWAGLWTARAIHNRAALGELPARTGGGIVVQRIVWSEASGVLQTVNVARGEPREIVVDVGLGLGEGVVRGWVGVDVFTVAKDDDPAAGPPRFHCVVGEKTQKVAFNRAAGRGTILVDTLQHERNRPALEYVELGELVRAARRLEHVYGYPLNVEFAIERGRLWILQARPVAVWLGLLRDALQERPRMRREGSR